MPYQYKNIEQALAEVFKVSTREMPAFRARIRDLRRVDVIPKSGSGRQIAYEQRDVIEIMVALQLELLGFSPKEAAAMVRSKNVKAHIADAEKAVAKGAKFFLTVEPGFTLDAKILHTHSGWAVPPVAPEAHRFAGFNLAASISLLRGALDRAQGKPGNFPFDLNSN